MKEDTSKKSFFYSDAPVVSLRKVSDQTIVSTNAQQLKSGYGLCINTNSEKLGNWAPLEVIIRTGISDDQKVSV